MKNFFGFTADHGIRQKSLGVDSQKCRCGECNMIFGMFWGNQIISWKYLHSIVEVTRDNWSEIILTTLPDHIAEWATSTIRTFLTYDNHHNYVGHVRDLFLLIRGLFDNDTIAQGLIDQRLFALTPRSRCYN